MSIELEESLRGEVVRLPYGRGSKSEHSAVCIQDADGHAYRLKIPGGDPFHDPALEALVGKEISVKGRILHGNTLLIKDWAVI